MRAAWDELVDRAPAGNIFLTFDWLATWWRHYGGAARLCVLAVHDGQDLVGLAPLMIDDRRLGGFSIFRRVAFLGTGISDRLDILAAPGREREILDALLSYLAGERWDVIDLHEIPEDSVTARLFPELAGRLGEPVEVTLQSVSPVIPLTADPDAYRSTLGKKLRENLTYYSRRLAKEHDVSLEFVTSAEGLPAKLDAFLGLYRTSLADRAAPELLGETFAAFRREVATQFARDGRLVLTLLRIDGSEAAAMLGFLHGGTFYDYNSCYDPAWKQASLGSILQWEVIRHAVARKCRELDMLRGEEDYKYRWGARPRRHVRIQITRDSPKLRVLRAATRLARWLGRRRLRAG